MNQFRVVVRQPLVAAAPGSSFGPTGKLKAKPPKPYTSSPELLAALAKSCLDDPEVDFSGSYPVSAAAYASDGVSDKQRVQTVTNDVWKATGYRFTVKDHPPHRPRAQNPPLVLPGRGAPLQAPRLQRRRLHRRGRARVEAGRGVREAALPVPESSDDHLPACRCGQGPGRRRRRRRR
ncbi:hypothetical protein B0H14DRAFT_2706115, partial [Mycena olivaceomarginata]